jgi:hypothetical protein
LAQAVLCELPVSAGDHGTERRIGERRLRGNAIDVSRLEYENLFRQVDDVVRRIQRIELTLHRLDARLETLENARIGNNRPSK